MKHTIIYFFALVISFFACQVLPAQEVWKMEVKNTDGTTTSIPVTEIESVTFAKKTIPPAAPGEAIDLGLNVKWASCNIGASKPEDYGDYYAWGETEVKTDYSESTYKYYQNGSYILIGDNISGTQYDVAHVKWGGKWRMPSEEDIGDLYEKCTWEWTTLNEVNGYIVTGPNGNSIFLPAAGTCYEESFGYVGEMGFYWLGNVDDFALPGEVPERKSGYVIGFDSEKRYYYSNIVDGVFPSITLMRSNGAPVRPVSD